MEHAQRGLGYKLTPGVKTWVLILILMEHAQRGPSSNRLMRFGRPSLNPYFNGTCSKRCRKWFNNFIVSSLNPYFNGTCSKRIDLKSGDQVQLCLNPYFNGTCSKRVDTASMADFNAAS